MYHDAATIGSTNTGIFSGGSWGRGTRRWSVRVVDVSSRPAVKSHIIASLNANQSQTESDMRRTYKSNSILQRKGSVHEQRPTKRVVKPDDPINAKFPGPRTKGPGLFKVIPFLAVDQDLALLDKILCVQGPIDRLGTAIAIEVNDLFKSVSTIRKAIRKQ